MDVDCYCYFKQALAFITEWNLSISVDTSGLRKHIIDVNSKAVYAKWPDFTSILKYTIIICAGRVPLYIGSMPKKLLIFISEPCQVRCPFFCAGGLCGQVCWQADAQQQHAACDASTHNIMQACNKHTYQSNASIYYMYQHSLPPLTICPPSTLFLGPLPGGEFPIDYTRHQYPL